MLLIICFIVFWHFIKQITYNFIQKNAGNLINDNKKIVTSLNTTIYYMIHVTILI